MNKTFFTVLFVASALFASAKGISSNPVPKQKQQPSNCIKQPEIVRRTPTAPKPEQKLYYVTKPAPIAKKAVTDNSIPHFSIFNFFNSFYTKDTLDRLQVM